jgi:hypothetical protein
MMPAITMTVGLFDPGSSIPIDRSQKMKTAMLVVAIAAAICAKNAGTSSLPSLRVMMSEMTADTAAMITSTKLTSNITTTPPASTALPAVTTHRRYGCGLVRIVVSRSRASSTPIRPPELVISSISTYTAWRRE